MQMAVVSIKDMSEENEIKHLESLNRERFEMKDVHSIINRSGSGLDKSAIMADISSAMAKNEQELQQSQEFFMHHLLAKLLKRYRESLDDDNVKFNDAIVKEVTKKLPVQEDKEQNFDFGSYEKQYETFMAAMKNPKNAIAYENFCNAAKTAMKLAVNVAVKALQAQGILDVPAHRVIKEFQNIIEGKDNSVEKVDKLHKYGMKVPPEHVLGKEAAMNELLFAGVLNNAGREKALAKGDLKAELTPEEQDQHAQNDIGRKELGILRGVREVMETAEVKKDVKIIDVFKYQLAGNNAIIKAANEHGDKADFKKPLDNITAKLTTVPPSLVVPPKPAPKKSEVDLKMGRTAAGG